jgi:hypothetical protein
MEAKDEEGGVWLLDPLALVASYGVEDEVRADLSHHQPCAHSWHSFTE